VSPRFTLSNQSFENNHVGGKDQGETRESLFLYIKQKTAIRQSSPVPCPNHFGLAAQPRIAGVWRVTRAMQTPPVLPPTLFTHGCLRATCTGELHIHLASLPYHSSWNPGDTRNARRMASVGDERERFGQELAGLQPDQLELACTRALEALADVAAEEDG
jgi:hypothetical protein